MMRSLAVVAVLAALGSGASAQPAKDQAAAAFAEGQRMYTAGDYTGAAAKFEAAYALDKDPVFLFNAAQAYRLGKSCTKAAAAYRKFLDAVPNPPNVAKVKEYLAQSEDCAKTEAPVVVAPPPPKQADVPIEHPIAVESPPPPPPVAPASHPGRTQKVAGLAIAGAGAISIAFGAYFSYRSFSLASDREDLCHGCTWDDTYQDKADDLHRKGLGAEHLAWVTLGVGGAAVVAGALLYLRGSATEREHATQLVVTPTDGGAMAMGAFRF